MTKDRAFKVFLALPSDVIDRLAEMGDAFQTDDEITKAVSRCVMLLYARRQDDRAEIHKMANIGVLRWDSTLNIRKRQKVSPNTKCSQPSRKKINLRYRSLETFSKTVQATAPRASGAWMGDRSRPARLSPIMTDELPRRLLSTVLRWSAAVARS